MSVIASLTSLFNRPPTGGIDLSNLQESVAGLSKGSAAGGIDLTNLQESSPVITEGLANAGATQSGGAKKSFSDILEKLVGEVDGSIKAADAEKAKVLSGESTNLHQAMIAMQEAGVAFSMMVEVRNKLVESYQEIMRMQV
jgi:flagellar hook-basal body complex protein FliE